MTAEVVLTTRINRLARANERHAPVVELPLFAGLSMPEIPGVLGVTPGTIQLDWRAASAVLHHVLVDGDVP